MEFTIFRYFSGDISFSSSLLVTLIATALCCLLAILFALRFKSDGGKDFSCSCGGKRKSEIYIGAAETSDMIARTAYCNGGTSGVGGAAEKANGKPVVVERQQSGASMMEQLVPEITTHALSYLDYPSLCRLSMTNSLMRKAANDDGAWKALYHKDFTHEQSSVVPVNGWKAYYASTRAIVNVNAEFFTIIREKSIPAMTRLWLNADYVKCFHANGEFFSGYNGVMESWELAFSWGQGVDFQIRDVTVRVLPEVAWVTMKAYVPMNAGPFNMTNVFEFHNGRWYIVHHHSSLMHHEGVQQPIVQG